MYQMKLKELIRRKRAKIGIIGMGYVGLPLARIFAQKRFKVAGFDIDLVKVKELNQGKSYIKHIPSATIKQMRSAHGFFATTNFRRLKEMDVIIACVPTPLTAMREPDLSFIESTSRTISQNFRRDQLIILESTTYPGTTKEVVLPILEKSGLKCGHDFYLAYSPEREDPGNPVYSTEKIPKVVGGIDETSGKLAQHLYAQVVQKVVPVSSTRVAEATKLLENIYRSVNIALVNELKMLFDRMGIDVWEVIQSAATKPFGFQVFYPGPGLGGHCIPIDPFYLSWKARQYDVPTRFIELAGEINTSMPYYVVSKTIETLSKKGKPIKRAKLLILGIAYKKDVDDMRESPALRLIELLQEKGARVIYNDPYNASFSGLRHSSLAMKSQRLTATLLKQQDAVIIATDHTVYNYQWIVNKARLVIDTRNATKNVKKNRHKIIRA